MNHKNILFVCEGNDDEKLLNIVMNNYSIDMSFSIYKYNTNIHLFTKYLFQYYSLDNGVIPIEDIDIIQVLKEYRYEINLDKKYTDILFVFDYDPQDPRFSAEMLTILIKTFSNSTDIGQLFINYPMIEASLDFSSLPDPEYHNKVCKLKDLKFNGYKNSVKKYSAIQCFDNLHKDDLRIILRQTLEKMIF